MEKEFYNIWIILVLFAFLYPESYFSNKLNIGDKPHPSAFHHSKKSDSTVTSNDLFRDSSFLVYTPKAISSTLSYSLIKGGPVTATVDPSYGFVCPFEDLQLSASGGENYLWVPNPGNPSGGSLSANNVPNPVFSNGFPGSFYVYDVIVTDNDFPPNGDTATVVVSVFNNPVISISPSPGIFVCENEEVILTASGGTTYRWEESVSGDSLGIGETLIVNPPITTTYRVIGYDSNGCWEINEIKIFVKQINEYANASTSGVCEGDSVLLTGGTGNQLTWYENNNIIGYGSSVYVYPTETTNYDLIIQNTSGCRDSAEVSVDFYKTPEVLNPIDDFTNCSGNSNVLGIQINQPIQSYIINTTGTFENDEIQGNLLTFSILPLLDTTSFSITLTGNDGGCSVLETFQIFPCSCIPPVVSSISITSAKCGGKDGSAMINIEEEGAYFYNWTPDLGTVQGFGNARIDLPFGVYIVEIIDTINADCSVFEEIIITNDNGAEANYTTAPANCSQADGTAIFTPANFEYHWEDLTISNSRNDLSSGIYFVTITDPLNPDCSSIVSVEIEEQNALSANFIVDTFPDCGSNNGAVSIQTVNGSGDYTFIWQDGLITTDSTRDGLFSGFYEVLIRENNPSSCELLFQFALLDDVGSAEINLIETIDATCNSTANGAIDFEINFDTSFVFNADTIITDGTFIYENGSLPVGDYCLYLLDGNDCKIDYLCFKISEPEDLGLLFTIEPDCGLGGSIELKVSGGTPPYTYDWSDISGNDNIGNRTDISSGNYALTVTDSNSCTLFNDLIVVATCSDTCNFFGGIDSLNLEAENCLSDTEYCFPTPISNLINCQIFDNGSQYSGVLASCNNDSISNGFALQFEPGHHEILIIDTLLDCYNILIVDVACTNSDNVCINEIKEFCVTAEDLNLIGEIATMTNLCSDTLNSKVSFEMDIDNLCVVFEGKSIGFDTACIEVCDFLGNCNTFDLIVNVDNCLLSTPDFLKDTIFINETVIYCPDTSELAGPVVSIDNFCPDQSGDFVEFFLDQNTFCVEYTGLEVGIDSTCIEICDNLGFCDTTYICVFVEESLSPPVALDDCDTTNMGTPVVINILANDTLLGRITSTKIISQPMWGTATVNLDRSVTYNASEEYCERIDSFYYEVCTEAGCDTASVCVWIECVDIFIFTAVSANRDGINDVFYIAGIEEYPESILRIFNRWGNLVYEKLNYRNTWSGTYNNSTDLPDGAYFYLLELNDEEKRVFKGYLQLFR